MDRRAFITTAAAAFGLAGCAEISGEAGPVHMDHHVNVAPEQAPDLIGVWEGPFRPRDGRGEGGTARMEIREVDGTLIRGRMTWTREGEVWREEDFTAALTRTGHYMFMHTHAMVHRRADEHFIMADVLMHDGNVYLHHLTAQEDVAFDSA